MMILSPTLSRTVRSSHNWGHIFFKAGVSYTAEASAELEGFGEKESITISAEMSLSNGGSHETSKTMSATGTCNAPPNTKTTCLYMAYQYEIEVDYTIHWINASPTHGTYKATGWFHNVTRAVEDL
jgi:hypothetical protein